MKKGIFLLIVCLVSIGILAVSAGADEKKWAMGCSGSGSGPYMWGATIAKLINRHSDLIQISPQASAGYNENVALVAAGDIAVGQQSGVGLIAALNGDPPFKGRPHPRLRYMFTFLPVPFHVVARGSAGINTPADLKGKKMNISLPAQITRTFNEAFLQAAGLGTNDIKVFEMATGQTFQGLQDGVIDATGNIYSEGHGGLLELMTNTNIRILDLPDDVRKKFLELVPATIPYTLKAGSYKGHDQPIRTIAALNVLFCRDDLDEKLVYHFTKTYWDNLSELKKDPGFKYLELDQAFADSVTVPMHPGSERYFREKGLRK
jgi:TRAP transporter TAXI family solute receptor